MTKLFQRTIEDFVCDHCGEDVKGDGYTDHCPKCLWSKHVDINPGDRASGCKGMMKPVKVDTERGEYMLTYRCEVCGILKRKKMQKDDNFDEVLKVAKEVAAK